MLEPFAWNNLLAQCVWIGDCLVWQGTTNNCGYGLVYVWRARRSQLVHRVAYEHAHGPIPPGLTVDHVKARGCRFKTCCNSAHLEAVTREENRRRANQ